MEKVKRALISVYHKEGLDPIVNKLHALGVSIVSTGGTYDYIASLGIPVTTVESYTGYPSILGGRVKTLHPSVMGGILFRRNVIEDIEETAFHNIVPVDMVIVDLYPFEETVKNTENKQLIIEKIDIGGISLIRAAAKNHSDVVVVSSREQYPWLLSRLEGNEGIFSDDDRKYLAAYAFYTSAHYDSAIFKWMNGTADMDMINISYKNGKSLRYGENPHQKGIFFGDLEEMFDQLHGKAISYNNLLDIDAAVALIKEFDEPTFAILKHNNACGIASRETIDEAWHAALAGDPVSAFGGVLVANRPVNLETAIAIDKIFFEVIIAPDYDDKALDILRGKKNRIILLQKKNKLPGQIYRSALNGVLLQERDTKTEQVEDFDYVTLSKPDKASLIDLVFAQKVVKHTKSNAIVLVKEKQLVGIGTGQTSRVDALKQAIAKAHAFQLSLTGAVMGSDAFFPFADSVEIAYEAGVRSVIQPGGSVRDNDSIEFCNEKNIAMVFTGIRHFKH